MLAIPFVSAASLIACGMPCITAQAGAARQRLRVAGIGLAQEVVFKLVLENG